MSGAWSSGGDLALARQEKGSFELFSRVYPQLALQCKAQYEGTCDEDTCDEADCNVCEMCDACETEQSMFI